MSMRMRSLAILLTLAVASAVAAQDSRPVAFVNARLVPISGPVIERGTLVVKNGKIEAIGADVAAPPGARVIDANGKTILPGLVSAVSRAGLGGPPPRRDEPAGGGRRRGGATPMPSGGGGGGSANRAATKIADGLYGKQPVFGELLRLGVTTLALTPNGFGFPGQGAVLRPDGKTTSELVANDGAFVHVAMTRTGETKKLLKETFEKAKQVVEARKKPPEPPPAAAPAAGEAKPPEKAPDAKEPPKGSSRRSRNRSRNQSPNRSPNRSRSRSRSRSPRIARKARAVDSLSRRRRSAPSRRRTRTSKWWPTCSRASSARSCRSTAPRTSCTGRPRWPTT